MQRLKCELCGSNDIVKQGGLYVCQHCGTKYSSDDAKKMMFQGTVRVNNLPSTNNLLELADSSLDAQNYKEAEIYSNRAIEINALNSKAWCYKALAIGHQAKECPSRIQEYVVCLNKTISLISDEKDRNETIESFFKNMRVVMLSTLNSALERLESNVTFDTSNDVYKLVQDINNRYAESCELYGKELGDFSHSITEKVVNSVAAAYDGNVIYDFNGDGKVPRKSDLDLFISRVNYLTQILDIVFPFCNDKEIKLSNLRVKLFILTNLLKAVGYRKKRGGEIEAAYSLSDERKNLTRNQIAETHKQIKQLDPTYKIPKQGCYIATAVYGSYDCPEVWVLRRFRDYTLSNSWYGRSFICLYYVISPKIIKWFGKTEWFKKLWKPRLDKIVNYLMDKGVANTPYNDNNWQPKRESEGAVRNLPCGAVEAVRHYR